MNNEKGGVGVSDEVDRPIPALGNTLHRFDARAKGAPVMSGPSDPQGQGAGRKKRRIGKILRPKHFRSVMELDRDWR